MSHPLVWQAVGASSGCAGYAIRRPRDDDRRGIHWATKIHLAIMIDVWFQLVEGWQEHGAPAMQNDVQVVAQHNPHSKKGKASYHVFCETFLDIEDGHSREERHRVSATLSVSCKAVWYQCCLFGAERIQTGVEIPLFIHNLNLVSVTSFPSKK